MNRKRGVTLAELVIVMAVLSVMMILVLSFTLICNAWVKLGTFRYNLTQDERDLSTLLHNFVSYLDESDYFFYTTDNNRAVFARRGDGNEYSFAYDRKAKMIRYQLPGAIETLPADVFFYDAETETIRFQLPDEPVSIPIDSLFYDAETETIQYLIADETSTLPVESIFYDAETETIRYQLPDKDETLSLDSFYHDPETDTIQCQYFRMGNFPIDKIDDMSFYIRPTASGLQLIYCTIYYTAPKVDLHAKETQESYRILVATRAAGNHGGN